MFSKTNTSIFESRSQVSPCFDLKNNFLKRYTKSLTLASTSKRQNHNLHKKMAEANEEKAASPTLTAEEAPVSIVTYRRRKGSIQSKHDLGKCKEKYNYLCTTLAVMVRGKIQT